MLDPRRKTQIYPCKHLPPSYGGFFLPKISGAVEINAVARRWRLVILFYAEKTGADAPESA
ncbi:hypothetical protein [[Enterobacter] lignolyticus]|uniref:Uncharacterized protein n=1 Tax=[Enterobacter] lignolyticus TaxID=1334193 RepID=A0A806X505_9ENTR|nr:hypothetical protein [[Enterobacter] lignolyticus]ALR76744.1 hypothetical protein AO703_10680 [[Enterobacter] lignolyticus]